MSGRLLRGSSTRNKRMRTDGSHDSMDEKFDLDLLALEFGCSDIEVKDEIEEAPLPSIYTVNMGASTSNANAVYAGHMGEDVVKNTIYPFDDDDEDREDAEPDPNKQLFLRRQPRRFAHTKTFSNGVADRATADWLKEHFQTKRGSLVPKGFLCDRYEEFCQTTGRKPMNNATLGRFIRGVFRGLETRRLGARQQSRYFYNNLGVRPSSDFVQLMMQEKRPSYVRRHRNLKPGQKSAPEEDGQPEPRLKERAHLTIPAYLPNFMDRRYEVARIASVEVHGQFSVEKMLTQLDRDGYQALIATAAQNESRILQLCEEVDCESTAWLSMLAISDVSKGTKDKNLTEFISQFCVHSKIFSRAVLIFDLDEIPAAMKSFWMSDDSTTRSQLHTMTTISRYELEELLNWDVVQNFVRRSYLRYYEKLLEVHLPIDESGCSSPTNDYVWTALHVIAVNYGTLMESVTTTLPEAFRLGLIQEAWAFSASLRERLNWSYCVAYIRQITVCDRLNSLIKRVFCDVFDSASTADILFVQLAGPMATFEEGLQQFCQPGLESVPAAWMKWFTDLVLSSLGEADDIIATSWKFENIRSAWITFLALFYDSIPPFEGDAHVKKGVFEFLIRAVSRVVSGQTEKLTGRTSLQAYAEKFCREEHSDTDCKEVSTQWWPVFLRMATEIPPPVSQATVESNAGSEVHQENPSSVRPVTPESVTDALTFETSGSGSSVRVSGRTGKGRNRWLDDSQKF